MINNWKYLCSDNDKILYETKTLINRSNNIRNIICNTNINTIENIIYIIGLISDDIYEFNSFHSLCGLLKLCKKNAIEADRIMSESTYEFYTNYDLYKKIKSIYMVLFKDKKNNLIKKKKLGDIKNNMHLKQFFEKILQNYKKFGIMLSEPEFKRTKNIIIIMNNLKTQVIENNKINYFKLNELLKFRYQYANLLKYNNYTEFKSKMTSDEINSLKITLKKIIDNLHNVSYLELREICKILNVNKVSFEDIKNAIRLKHSKYLFNIKFVINKIFEILYSLFKIKFEFFSEITAWNKNISIYSVKFDNEISGYLYIDGNKYDSVIKPMSIILNEPSCYPLNTNILRVPIMILLYNYNSEITYKDIISIFKEFGPIVHTIFHRSKYGNLNIIENMKLFTSCLFECIVNDIDISIKNFCENNTEKINYINNIIKMDKAFKAKIQCANTLFDYYLHTKLDSNYLSKDLQNNENDYEIFYTKKYNLILKEILNTTYDLMRSEIQIPHDVIVDQINYGGLIHIEITNNLLSYELFSLLKHNKLFMEFSEVVFRETLIPFKTAVHNFIKKYDKNNLALNINKFNNLNSVYSINCIKSNESYDYDSYLNNKTIDIIKTENNPCSENLNYFTEN